MMFCQGCGRQLDDSAQFCTACGRPARLLSATLAPTAAQTLSAHVRVMGILWGIYGGLQILMAFWTVAMSHFYASLFEAFVSRDPNFPTSFLPFLRSIFVWSGIFSFVTGAIAAFAGWALLRREASARVIALVAAFASLISFPLGTGLGLYTLIEFLPSSARETYEQMTAGRR